MSVGFEEMPTSEGEPRRKQRSEEDSEEGIWVSRIPTFLFAEGADYFFFQKISEGNRSTDSIGTAAATGSHNTWI